MADLLGEVDTNIPSRLPAKTIKSAARRKTRVLSPPLSQSRNNALPKVNDGGNPSHLSDTPPPEPSYNDHDDFPTTMFDDDVPMSDPTPSSPIANAIERKGRQSVKEEEEEEDEDEDEDIMVVAKAVGGHNVKTASINLSGSRPAPKVLKKAPYPSPQSSSPTRPPSDAVDPSAWNDVTSKLNVLSSQGPETTSFGKLKLDDAVEDSGSLRMFWTDYTEINGSLCLFGKVKDKTTGSFVSAFVKVDNILRKLYFLPRTHRQRKCYISSFRCSITEEFQGMAETPLMKLGWATFTMKWTKS